MAFFGLITTYEIALAFCQSTAASSLPFPPPRAPTARLTLSFSVLAAGRIVINLFFREIRPRGAYNIPRTGPVLFVGAPHQLVHSK